MKTTQSRQKSYADVRRRPLAFEFGDHVFIKIAPLKGVVRFGKKALDLLPNLSYEEMQVQILDRKVKVLRNREIGLVKVLWMNHVIEEATWEPEEETKHRYPNLFDSAGAVPQLRRGSAADVAGVQAAAPKRRDGIPKKVALRR
ncbi:uncharacterized protein [Primulina huaijiensis]|uniref:uncharacterized protein n=1 Tax=Primulina huaijiensis TaxID=1492673 RepID=UPI003CC77573